SGSSQVWRMALDGGEPERVTDLPVDVDNLDVFPDGRRLLLTLEVYPDAKSLAESAAHDEKRAKEKDQARVYESLMVRHWDAWEDGKKSHVFVWTPGAPESGPAGGTATDLMAGMDVDSPTKPFGGGEELAISPDGQTVVFSAKDEGRSDAWSTNVDVW